VSPDTPDTLRWNGLVLRVRIGFHDFERTIVQAVRLDLEVQTDFREGPERDRKDGLVDYYELAAELVAHVEARSYDLIEALAVDVAREVVKRHPRVVARVRVYKKPIDLPMLESVTAECVRSAKDFP
jgi:FolB domain-containing protein